MVVVVVVVVVRRGMVVVEAVKLRKTRFRKSRQAAAAEDVIERQIVPRLDTQPQCYLLLLRSTLSPPHSRDSLLIPMQTLASCVHDNWQMHRNDCVGMHRLLFRFSLLMIVTRGRAAQSRVPKKGGIPPQEEMFAF